MITSSINRGEGTSDQLIMMRVMNRGEGTSDHEFMMRVMKEGYAAIYSGKKRNMPTPSAREN
jgi:hypothetical protein